MKPLQIKQQDRLEKIDVSRTNTDVQEHLCKYHCNEANMSIFKQNCQTLSILYFETFNRKLS